MSEKRYIYETKCRRCGKIHEWFFANVGTMPYHWVQNSMNEKAHTPSNYPCSKCKKCTVQDLVYYSPVDGE